MKVGKIPVTSIILVVITLTALVLNKVYPGLYTFESPFIVGMFAGSFLVLFLYHLNLWIAPFLNNRKDLAKNENN
jgi:hypothetical protein